jgi:hypothetical protein
MERVRAMLIGSGLPSSIWPEAVNYAFYLKNRSPTSALKDDITHFEAFTGKKPDISNVPEFGAKIWVLRQDGKVHKVQAKARQYRFVGLWEQAASYRYYNPGLNSIQHSRNVIFQHPDTIPGDYIVPAPFPSLVEGENKEQPPELQPNSVTPPGIPPMETTTTHTLPHIPTPVSTPSTVTPPPPSPEPSSLPRKAPRDISSAISSENIIEGKRTRSSRANLDFAFTVAEAASLDNDPKSVKEACTRSDWLQWQLAMDAEMSQLMKLGTWELIDLPAGRKAIPCRWVYRLKRDAAGKVVKYKGRLVVKGFSQIPGIDFNETFAPTIRLETFRFLIALAARYKLKSHGMDVVAAYLNSPLEETVYMQQPEGYDDGTGRVCRLKLSLYGLRQSGHNWNRTLDSAFKELGFTRLISDQCVYLRRKTPTSSPTIVAVHVDDMTLFAQTDAELSRVKGELSSKFTVTDLGELKTILGMEIVRNANGSISLTQSAYAERVLESVGIVTAILCLPHLIPM